MTPDDMAAIHAACFTTPRPWTATEFTSLLATKGVFAQTAPQAILLGRVIVDEAELLTLAVAPGARRGGTGHLLVAQFIATAAAAGAQHAFLEVAANNAAAIALYAKSGFVESGRRKKYYHAPDGQHVDALVMARSLKPA